MRKMGLAVGLVLAAVIARLLLEPLLGNEAGFMFFFPVVLATAWFAGRNAALVATGGALVAVWYFWLPPYHSFKLGSWQVGSTLVAFAIVATAIAHVTALARQAMTALDDATKREAALRQDYEVTLRSIADAVIATDADLRVTFMNRAAELLTGWPFSEARDRHVDTVFRVRDEHTGQPTTSPLQRALAERTVVGFTNHTLLVTRDGRDLAIANSAAPILTEGEPRGAVLVFHDVSEQANVRKQLREANATLTQQVEDWRRLHEFSWRVHATKDMSELLEQVLAAALEVNGASRGLLGLVVPGRDGLVAGASRGFPPKFLECVSVVPPGLGPCGSCYQLRQRVVVEDARVDPVFADAQHLVELGQFRAVHSTPLITRHGVLVGVLSVHFDTPRRPAEREMRLMDVYAQNAADLIENAQLHEQVSRELAERRKTEEELRITNARFRLAAFSDPLTLYEQDADLRYLWVYPPHPSNAGALGRTDAEIIGPEEAATVTEVKRRVLMTGTPERAEVRATLGQRARYFDVTVAPKRNEAGEIEGVAGAALDITERKEAELALIAAKDELARANAELETRVRERTASLTDLIAQMETFSYSVSHDMRSPLRAIAGFAEVLRDDHAAELSPPARQLLDRIIRGGQRLNRLINDVLAYSRVNREKLDLGPVSLDDVLRQVISHAPELQSPHADIQVPAPLHHVIGNDVFLTQVLANLLGNAVKFVAAGTRPQVRVTSERRGTQIRLIVQDNGIGIPPQHCARLFALFERVHTRGAYEGTGMGLAIVRRAVERMGGTAGVESDGATGSTFWFELQAAPGFLPSLDTRRSAGDALSTTATR